MREAFSNQNQPKSKAKQQHNTQLSQRQGHPSSHHQKTSSAGNKALMPSQNLNIALEEQHAQILQATAAANSHLHQSLNMGSIAKSSTHGAGSGNGHSAQMSSSNHHKKSNSMVNAKMAQIILKGPTPSQTSGQQMNSQLNQHSMMTSATQASNAMSIMMGQTNNTAQQYMVTSQQQAQSNMNTMMQASKGTSFQHQNHNLTGSMLAPTSTLVMGQLGASQQTSFQQQNELPSYSIDYTKQPHFQEDLEDLSNQSTQLLLQQNQQQIMMSQASSKQHLLHQNMQRLTQPLPQQMALEILVAAENQTVLKKSAIITGAKPQSNLNIYQGTQKQITIASMPNPVQKITKKVASAPSHQRTKSDTQYNRANINIKSSQQQIGGSQSKRSNGANQSSVRVNFIEVDQTANSRQAAQHPNFHHKQSGIQTLNDHIMNSLGPRKPPNSANHSKKPSLNAGGTHNLLLSHQQPPSSHIHTQQMLQQQQLLQHQLQLQQQQMSHPKKSTKEKYIELKSMYDELLEKHYAQQQQFQQQQQQLASSKFPQSVSNNNLIGLYNLQQQQPQISHLVSGGQQMLVEGNLQMSTTPRMMIQNQLSQSALNQNSNNMFFREQINATGGVNQFDTKPNQPVKTTISKQINMKQPQQPQVLPESEASKLQPKSIMKLQMSQGQSRKQAQGGHKRSVSDGNDQLFKFKQQQMQRYLYPQPSNQIIQSISPMNQQNHQQLAMGDMDELVSERQKLAGLITTGVPNQQSQITLAPTPYQQPSHQRRVSDDYMQKQKRISTIAVVNTSLGGSNSNGATSKKQLLQQQLENVGEQANDSAKLQTIDFNIKSFLLDMRNKQQQNATGGGFITVIDEQQPLSQTSPLNFESSGNHPVPPNTNQQNQRINSKNGKHFAMIIEENSPKGEERIGISQKSKQGMKISSGNMVSPRKGSLLPDSQSQQALSQQNNKPTTIDFSKLQYHRQQNYLKAERSQSPSVELVGKQQQNSQPKKSVLAKVNHKRVKSDVTEPSSIMQEPITTNMYVKHNNPINLQAQVLSKQQQPMKKGGGLNTINSGSNFGQGGHVSISDKNTPTKQRSSKIMVPGHLVKKQPNQQKYMINQQMESSLGSRADDNKKVVNVSIELIKDEFERSRIDESNYIDSNKNLHWVPDMIDREPATHHHQLGDFSERPFKQSLSGGSNNENKKEKYKKMKEKYKQVVGTVGGVNNSPRHEQQPFKMTHQKDNRKYTFDMGVGSGLRQSNSPSPSNVNVSPKGRLSINERVNEQQKRQQSSKIFLPNSPKGNIPSTLYPKQKIKVQNLMIQPGSRKQSDTDSHKGQEIHHPVINNANIKSLHVSSPNNAPPNNSVVQTQESPRHSQLILAPLVSQVSERIETQDSDIGLSPRSRAVSKIMKHIKLSFRQARQSHNTTVDFYRIGKVLGKGAFGKVNLALHKLSGRFAAVKSINKQYLSEDAQTKKVMQEVVILKRTRHRNIVRLYEFFETQKHILFVIELCAGGDLLNYVRKRRRLKEDVAKCIFKQIVEGLAYCHSKSILHRDIKLDNILLDSEGEVKICDFGVSKIVKQGEIMTEQCGTPAYIAPEILRDKGYQGFAVDIWSAGVVLYAMLYGTVPFKANNMSELQKLIVKAKYTLKDDGVSEDARNLLTGLLEKDPAKRLSIPQILQHKWFGDVNEKIELFTDQEKEYIKNEFTYNETERFNRNEDPFTEHMLDSTNNSMLKNNETKSVILAPFNSTKSDVNAPAITKEMLVMVQSKNCIKFAPRCREVDKQYENNNNADLDNGVYHKQEEEDIQIINGDKKVDNKLEHNSQDSLQSSFNKQSSLKSDDDEEQLRIQQKLEKQGKLRKEKQTELEKLESLICQKEEEAGDDPYSQPHDQDTSKYGKDQTVLESQQTLIIDDKAIGLVELMGYPREFLLKSLNNNDLNYATTGYYLLINKHALTFGGVTALTLMR